MKRRKVNYGKAYNSIQKIDPEETKLQQKFTQDIQIYIKEYQNNYYNENPTFKKNLTNHIAHQHICAFEIFSSDKKWCNSMCKKEREKLPLPKLDSKWDYCDYCPKMTYVAFDNDLNIIYVERTFTEEMLKNFPIE